MVCMRMGIKCRPAPEFAPFVFAVTCLLYTRRFVLLFLPSLSFGFYFSRYVYLLLLSASWYVGDALSNVASYSDVFDSCFLVICRIVFC